MAYEGNEVKRRVSVIEKIKALPMWAKIVGVLLILAVIGGIIQATPQHKAEEAEKEQAAQVKKEEDEAKIEAAEKEAEEARAKAKEESAQRKEEKEAEKQADKEKAQAEAANKAPGESIDKARSLAKTMFAVPNSVKWPLERNPEKMEGDVYTEHGTLKYKNEYGTKIEVPYRLSYTGNGDILLFIVDGQTIIE